VNPNTNGPHHPPRYVALTLKRIADGREIKIAVPPDAYLNVPLWSADGKHFVFTNTLPQSIELWVGDTQTGQVRKLDGVRINAVSVESVFQAVSHVRWMPDHRTLLVPLVPPNRGRAPAPPPVPQGPNVQESSGKTGPIFTYQD